MQTEDNNVSKDVEPEDCSVHGRITTPYNPGDIRIISDPMNIGDLIERIDAGWINLDTEYQRQLNLWSTEDQSRLVESILLGLRLPAFYFEEVSRRQWNVIDGLQRCCALANFCVKKTLKLTGLEFLGEQFEGMGYDDFPFDVKRDFRMLAITVHRLAENTPSDVKYILFRRLNTGGVPLKPQEIRTAIFPTVMPIIKRMAGSEAFRRATGGKISIKRQEDRDFVSRFVAFYLLGSKAYTADVDIDGFINKSMQKLTDAPADVVNRMERDFERSLDTAYGIFAEDAFRKRERAEDARKPINKALFEVLTAAFAHLNPEQCDRLIRRKDELKQSLLGVMSDPQFRTSISTGTGILERVRTRHQRVGKEIDKLLDSPALEGWSC